MTDEQEFSLKGLRQELEELRKDYCAFTGAYDLITQRITESTFESAPRNPMLHVWSGSRAACGTLELCMHAINRTIQEYDELVRKIENGEIRNSDKPSLAIVEGDSE